MRFISVQDCALLELVPLDGEALVGVLSLSWFSPTGEEPELLYFSAPQYNTWIELTYHQNENDILEYAKSMLDNGLPPGKWRSDDGQISIGPAVIEVAAPLERLPYFEKLSSSH